MRGKVGPKESSVKRLVTAITHANSRREEWDEAAVIESVPAQGTLEAAVKLRSQKSYTCLQGAKAE